MVDAATDLPEVQTDGDAAQKQSFMGGGMAKMAIILTVAMLGEAGVFYFLGLTPGLSSNAADSEDAQPATAEDMGTDQEALIEVAVDAFNVTNRKAITDSVVHITFKLVALVSAGNQVEFNEAVNKHHNARVRQAVTKVVRSSGIDDLDDANLSNLKRDIREQVNKVLRTSYVVEVVITDFKTMEQ